MEIWHIIAILLIVVLIYIRRSEERELREIQEQQEQERQQKEDREKQRVIDLIQKNIIPLSIKYQEVIRKDIYETIDYSRWLKEIKKFYTSVIKYSYLYHYNYYKEMYGRTQFAIQNDKIRWFEFCELVTYKVEEYISVSNVKDTEQRYNKTGEQFETEMQELITSYGYKCYLTSTTGDQGVDLIVEKNGKKVAIQCKYYSHNVGNKAVQEVNAGKIFYNCDYGIVLSNADYSQSAKELANRLNIALSNPREIIAVLDKFYEK